MRQQDSSDGSVIFTLLHPMLIDKDVRRQSQKAWSLQQNDLSATQTAAGCFQRLHAAHPRCPIRDAFYCCRIQIQDFLRQETAGVCSVSV